eukprot:scaffold236_cov164-Ochromonas_danica.AAC.9
MEDTVWSTHTAKSTMITVGNLSRGPDLANVAIAQTEGSAAGRAGRRRSLACITLIAHNGRDSRRFNITSASSKVAAMAGVNGLAAIEEKTRAILLIMVTI